MNPNRNANTTPIVGGASASHTSATSCSCGNLMNPSNNNVGGNGGNANAFNININNGAFNDGSVANSADTLLSSNAKFQAISAIAVSQDGVINVADQGMYHYHFSYKYTFAAHMSIASRCECVVGIFFIGHNGARSSSGNNRTYTYIHSHARLAVPLSIYFPTFYHSLDPGLFFTLSLSLHRS